MRSKRRSDRHGTAFTASHSPSRSRAALPLSLRLKSTRVSHAPMKPRITYIERKAGSLIGTAWIGRVTFNRTGRTNYYRDQAFRRIVGGVGLCPPKLFSKDYDSVQFGPRVFPTFGEPPRAACVFCPC